jgi:hypothetical protein
VLRRSRVLIALVIAIVITGASLTAGAAEAAPPPVPVNDGKQGWTWAGEREPVVGEATVDATDRTRAYPRLPGSPAAPGTDAGPREPSDPAWGLIDEVDVYHRVTVGGRYAVQLDYSTQELLPLPPADPLTAIGRQAVDRAPTWLQKQLEDNLARMSAAQQDKWGQKVLDAVDPYVDEVAFLIAHISPQDLAWSNFYAQLIDDSSTYAYEVDPDLDYVQVLDEGSAAEGGDYWTTVVYEVELDGVVSSVEYPREIYYWFLVHPRGSDERPTYIDPVPCSSSGTPAAPPTGKFWRRWLYYNTENKFGGECDVDRDGTVGEPCPLLKETVADTPVLWRHNEQGKTGAANGAVGLVNDWVRQSLGKFGDRDDCRPVQPVTVYYHNDGNCGEWADLTMAAGRAALIPTEVTGTRVNDHVWNEFYDQQWDRWVQWEPVNNMVDDDYSGWWDGKIAATHTYRGDGYGHTARTSQHGPSATLTVTVYDANHYPVDGALVYLGSPHDLWPLVMEASLAHTDANGQVVFTVGDLRDYHVFVETPWGRYPSSGWAKVVENAQPDTAYEWSPPDFSGAVPRLQVSDASSSGTLDDNLLEVSYSVVEGYVHGESFVGGIRYSKAHPGDVDFFIADQTNWDAFEAGSAFQAFEVAIDDAGREASFIPPESGDWYVAWSNEASMDMNHIVRGTVSLYENTGAVPPVENLEVDKDATDASLLDWEDVTGQNVDGYNVYRSTDPYDVGADRTESELEPYEIAHVDVSEYEDPDVNAPGTCYFYSVRTVSSRGGISP